MATYKKRISKKGPHMLILFQSSYLFLPPPPKNSNVFAQIPRLIPGRIGAPEYLHWLCQCLHRYLYETAWLYATQNHVYLSMIASIFFLCFLLNINNSSNHIFTQKQNKQNHYACVCVCARAHIYYVHNSQQKIMYKTQNMRHGSTLNHFKSTQFRRLKVK